MQADVQERGWVRVSVGVIDEQPPAGRSSVPERASNCTLQPATAALGGEAPKRVAWTDSLMICVPAGALPAARFQGFANVLVAAGVPLGACMSGVDVMAASCSEAGSR